VKFHHDHLWLVFNEKVSSVTGPASLAVNASKNKLKECTLSEEPAKANHTFVSAV